MMEKSKVNDIYIILTFICYPVLMIRQAFSRAAAKPEGSSGTDFLEAILEERPDLRGQMAYFPGERPDADGHAQGGAAHTIFIGDEVFKAPKCAEWTPHCDAECKILQQMEGKGLPVPKLTYVGKKAFFFGMTRMPGVNLSSFEERQFTREEMHMLAGDIADFVIGMAQAFPLREDGKFMAHEDLHVGNILVNPQTKRLSGIIDFGSVNYNYYPVPCPLLDGDLKRFFDIEYKRRKKQIPGASLDIKGRLLKYMGFKHD